MGWAKLKETMNKKWFTVKEAAEYFSIKKQTLYGLIGRGLVPGDAVLRLGRQIRLDIKKIEEKGIKRDR